MSDPLSPPTPDESVVGDEIQLISDGDGLAVIGHEAAVERFLVSEGLQSRDLGLPRLRGILAGGAGVAQAAAVIASASGRWVQLTDESVSAINKWGLMKSNQTGLSMGVVYSKGDPEGIKKIVQFVSDPGTVGSRALNPLVLSNAAALMAQVAMQQAMDEITDYLATIDEKVDDILRAQKDAVIDATVGEPTLVRDPVPTQDESPASRVHRLGHQFPEPGQPRPGEPTPDPPISFTSQNAQPDSGETQSLLPRSP